MKMKQARKPVNKDKRSNAVKKKKKNLGKMSTDDFFSQGFDDDSDDESLFTKKEHSNMDDSDELIEEPALNKEKNSDIENNEEDASDSENELDAEKHKKSLNKLKDTDPHLYKYLQQNDKDLLNFDVSDDSDNEGDDKHVPDEDLEVASDESDYEGDEGVSAKKVTLKLLNTWQDQIQTDKSAKTIKDVVEVFRAAVETVADSKESRSGKYIVEGGAVFNRVVQLCVLQLPAALKRYLNIGAETRFEAHKAKKFVKVKGTIKTYLTSLIKVLHNVTSTSILTVLLKHLHQMLPYTQSYSSLNKPLLRILLRLWSSAEENVRVVAFLNILYLATTRKESILESLLKTMYVKYVENSKFVSPNTLPGINFMKHSLAEIYMLDSNLSYSHAFLYIRQMAIHLRNAVTLKKKENFQAVYNWQYINSLRFWTELITLSKSQSMMRSLLYPLVQIIIGTIKLIPTAQYYPLRFHCVQLLISISEATDVFIPILPFLLEILNQYDFDKRHKAVSMKPLSLMCVLRMSKAQLQENGYKNSLIETIYELILQNAAKDSHTIYYPDLYVPCVIQLKAFLKKCHVANHCRKIKQLLDKIEENRKFIENERNKVAIDLKDLPGIENWETRVKQQGTPLKKFYDSWIKIHQSQKLKLLTQNDDTADYKLPVIKRKRQKTQEKDDESLSEGSGSDVEEEEAPKKKQKTSKKKSGKKSKVATHEESTIDENAEDVVKDIADWD